MAAVYHIKPRNGASNWHHYSLARPMDDNYKRCICDFYAKFSVKEFKKYSKLFRVFENRGCSIITSRKI